MITNNWSLWDKLNGIHDQSLLMYSFCNINLEIYLYTWNHNVCVRTYFFTLPFIFHFSFLPFINLLSPTLRSSERVNKTTGRFIIYFLGQPCLLLSPGLILELIDLMRPGGLWQVRNTLIIFTHVSFTLMSQRMCELFSHKLMLQIDIM